MFAEAVEGTYTFQSTLSVRRATANCAISAAVAAFQSTLSVRRATGLPHGHGGGVDISIHALREESDSRRARTCPPPNYFNPRSP